MPGEIIKLDRNGKKILDTIGDFGYDLGVKRRDLSLRKGILHRPLMQM
jgi:hypothetical protein